SYAFNPGQGNLSSFSPILQPVTRGLNALSKALGRNVSLSKKIGPDLAVPFTSLIEPDAMPQLKNVVQDVNGATDSVYLDSSVKFGLVEVKAGFGERKGGGPTDMIPEGVAQVVAYATALKAAKLPGVAILMVDSGAWKKLSLDQRTAALAATKA